MGPDRVVVTGLGVVSAIGQDQESFWASLRDGRHGFREITLADCSDLQFQRGGEIAGIDVDGPFDRSTRELLDRFARFWILAAREAVADSGLSPAELAEAGVVNGSSLGGQSSEDDLFLALYRDNRRRLTPFAVPRLMTNSGASQLTMEMGIEGPAFTLSTACASSTHAIGLGAWLVSQGQVDRAIVGGSEAPFSRGHLKAWDSLRVMASDVCRPFSLGRRGMMLGEGGAALVIETLDAARARGARIRAELVGFGMSSDASHITKPEAKGAARALRAALKDAALEPQSISYVNAHGTGTLINDATETRALRDVFGEHVNDLLVSSTKSMHGHALGGSGALEAVATVLSLERGIVPPTANFVEPDPECAIDCVPNVAREARLSAALSSSFAFGGLNAVIVLKPWIAG